MRFLVMGHGSIGARHTSILRKMGHKVLTVDPSPAAQAGRRQFLGDWHGFDGILDCTPPNIRAGWSIPAHARFVEKPLGITPDKIDCPVMMGFCYRWLPSLERFINNLPPVYSVAIVQGQHLQDYHATDYRLRYHGIPGQGGVILDSMPHMLFIARWILGEIHLVGAVSSHLSTLDICTEDTAAVLLKTPIGQPCQILVDYLRRPRAMYIEAVTEKGERRWSLDLKEVEVMYQRQMTMFCRWIQNKPVQPPNFQEGQAVQRLLEEIACSS